MLSAQQMVEGHLKPAAGVLAENLPGIARQLAEQPIKEQGGLCVVCFALGVAPPLEHKTTAVWFWDCACCAAAGKGCWIFLAQQVVEGHLRPAAGVLAQKLPGIAQQLAEQPLKEQGGLCVVCFALGLPPSSSKLIAVGPGKVRAVRPVVGKGSMLATGSK
jgi:hypothetical protein